MYEKQQFEDLSIRFPLVYSSMILISSDLKNENMVVIMVIEYDPLIGSAHDCYCSSASSLWTSVAALNLDGVDMAGYSFYISVLSITYHGMRITLR